MNIEKENKTTGEIIRECVLSCFNDEINKEYSYEDYLNRDDKVTPPIAAMVMINNDTECLNLCVDKDTTKQDIINYILDNKKYIVESVLGNLDYDTFMSLSNLIDVLDKNGYYSFDIKDNIPFNLQILRVLNTVKLIFLKTTNNITEIHIPKDIVKIMKKALNNDDILEKSSTTDFLCKSISGLISIYGVIKLNDLPILDSYFKDYSYYELEEICWRLSLLEPGFETAIYDDEQILYTPNFDDVSDAIKILDNNIKYKKYDDETLEKIYEEEFIDTLAPYKELKKTLKKLKFDEKDIEHIKDFIINEYIILNQMDSDRARNVIFTNLKEISNNDEFNQMIYEYAVKTADKYPRWDLRGDIPQTKTVKVEKVGRNELCPCGSGKKYKKCCGK